MWMSGMFMLNVMYDLEYDRDACWIWLIFMSWMRMWSLNVIVILECDRIWILEFCTIWPSILGVLTLLAESIPRQEDSQALVSKQAHPSVNYRSDSQNRLKRGTHSGLLNNHWTWSPLICSVIFFLARRTLLFAWLTFFAVALGFHIVPQRENSQAKSYL